MAEPEFAWRNGADKFADEEFRLFHIGLADFNSRALEPGLPDVQWRDRIAEQATIAVAECDYIEAVRREIEHLLPGVPDDSDGFVSWFERLEQVGPGQNDVLFPWLAETATMEQMRWFLLQEVAGEAGFEDLLALTQVKFSETAKLEMARNYWDEMGRGHLRGMHGPMLARLATHLELEPSTEVVIPQSLALGNAMLAMARHRQYAYHSVGALGVIEMTAPGRASLVNQGLKRLGVTSSNRHYFALHSTLDVKHSQAWNAEVLRPLVGEDPRRARPIAEGALIRLWHGARCFEAYRRELGVTGQQSQLVFSE